MSAGSVLAAELPRTRSDLARFAGRHAVTVATVVLLVYAAIAAPRFYAGPVLDTTLRTVAILGLIGVGQLLVMYVQGLDLSVGGVVGLTAVALTTLATPAVGLLAAAGIAVAVGLANAWLIVSRRIPPFVTTFGMMIFLEGVRLMWTRGSASASSPAEVTAFARSSLVAPVPLLLLIAACVAAAVVLHRTVGGRRMVLSGSNETMARLSGLRPGRYKIAAYVLAALLAVVAGTLLTGFTGYVDSTTGRDSALDALTVALLAGGQFKGGEGSFFGVFVGALLLASSATLIVVLGLRPELQDVVRGVILIGALALQAVNRR